MDQKEDLKMEDARRSRSEEEQAMHACHNSHQLKSEGNRWKSSYTSCHSGFPVGSLPDEPTSSQAEQSSSESDLEIELREQ